MWRLILQQLILPHRRRIRSLRRRVIRRGSLRGEASEYKQKKSGVQIFVCQRLTELNQAYGLQYRRVTIKNTATRWGSCSRAGNLNFHYRIGQLPANLADYILVHELCHLQELNHSRRFWQLVSQTIPDYVQRRVALKNLWYTDVQI